MVVKRNSSSKKKVQTKTLLQDVPVPPKKEKLVFPELQVKKKMLLKNVPLFPSVKKKEPFDFVTAEHRLFKKWDIFHLRSRKVFPLRSEIVTVTEEPVEQHSLFEAPREVPSFSRELLEEEHPIVLPPNAWQKTQELLLKCRIAIDKEKLEYAQIYYEELQPFYSRLEVIQQKMVSHVLLDLRQDIEMLKLTKLHEQLRRAR